MNWMEKWLKVARWLALVAMMIAAREATAASFSENKAIESALRSFQLEKWDRAEREFSAFAKDHPTSERYAEAILYEAKSQYKQGLYAKAVELLSAERQRAGTIADQFAELAAEAHFKSGNFGEAAVEFGKLAAEFPTSRFVMDAVLGEADARTKLMEWKRVVELLGDPAGLFQQAVGTNPTNDLAVRGYFLLSEAELAQGYYDAAIKALQPVAGRTLNPEQEWQKQYLLGRVELAEGSLGKALESSTNIIAASVGAPAHTADSISFQARVLEQMDRFAEAVDVYQGFKTNTAQALPLARQRQITLKIVELDLRQDKIDEAGRELSGFLDKQPSEKGSDVALLTLGELHLKQHYRAMELAPTSATATNYLEQAMTNLAQFVTAFTNSQWLGKAQLNLGWCYWAAGRIPESQAAFGNAVSILPLSEDQAVARFKLGDIQFQQKDFAGAINRYKSILNDYGAFQSVRHGLFEQALYQIVRAGIEETNQVVVDQSLAQLLNEYPDSFLTERSLLLMGQGWHARQRPSAARELLLTFVNHFTNSDLVPEAKLAIARTYERESQWSSAIEEYRSWISIYTNNPALPRAEFSLAAANYSAGNETNAFSLYTNFVGRYSNDRLAPVAQYWVGDYYLRHEIWDGAEAAYQEVFKKWRTSDLYFQAAMMSGRAAMAREAIPDACSYFTNYLTSDPKCPPGLRLEALYAYGDAMMRWPVDTNNPATNLKEAVRIFTSIVTANPTNAMAALAQGRIGDCYLALGARDPLQYDAATNAYQKVMDSPVASVTARSMAETGRALVLEKLARLKSADEQERLLKEAENAYLDVVTGKRLREGESPDLFWVREAGMAAGKIEEELGEWESATVLYQTLQDMLPSLQKMLERRAAHAREGQALQKGTSSGLTLPPPSVTVKQ